MGDGPEVSDKRRTIDEILGDVEAYTQSIGGPGGPWTYRTLTVRRTRNTITVRDADGELCGRTTIQELQPEDDDETIAGTLRAWLERLNEDTLDNL